ncbi:MAG: hypothetical protein ACREBG_14070 [Pyrinomonadaceae bacterium]
MQKAIITVLFLVNVVPLSVAQQLNDVQLDASKPSVYLTFERFGENDFVWLRLHNNTRWAISFLTEDLYEGVNVTPLTLSDGRQVSGLVDDLEISPEYFVEQITDRVTTHGRYWCTASTSWLPAARSVVFSFSRKDLKEWDQIYITFVYEWEIGSNPEHRVKFYGRDFAAHH